MDQNQYHLDGTSITATGNGVSRADPGVDFIQELQIIEGQGTVNSWNVVSPRVGAVIKLDTTGRTILRERRLVPRLAGIRVLSNSRWTC